ncbi:MAG: helix-turn-helix transcriptional regulator [Clostridia bacterium]|nr:helix-turn-helix transcriptional regulator [Clostridia bacterium]
MKKFDISELMISKIFDVYGDTLEDEAEIRAKTEHCALIFKHSGRSVYTIDSKKYTADSEQILFLPPQTAYELYARDAGPCTVIEFDIQDTEEELPVCEYFVGADSELFEAVRSVQYYWNLKGPSYHSKCLSDIYGLLTEIATIHANAHTLCGKYPLIHRSVKYIEANYAHDDRLYTPMLADLCGIGETYYRSIFLAVFKMPPAKYIAQYRIAKAKEMLSGSAASVEEIAVKVGFANASYFCKVFKSITGQTPSEFARTGRKLG